MVSDGFLAACVTLDAMPSALQGMADRVDAAGATLVRSRGIDQHHIITSPRIADAVAKYATVDRPPDPRQERVKPTLAEGFRIDQDDFSPRELASDPFYQEFLRPHGLGWNACALLARSSEGDEIHVSLKRPLDQTPFDRDDFRELDAHLSLLRTAAGLGATLGLAQSASEEVVGRRRRALYRLGRHGHALLVEDRVMDAVPAVAVRNGVLVAVDRRDQPKIRATVDRARASGTQAAAMLTDGFGHRWAFRVIPAGPAASDPSLIGWAVVAALDAGGEDGDAFIGLGRDLFGLSRAEARVALWIARGESVEDVARRLSSSPGTVRNQLKKVFAKTGVSRQAELAVLLNRL